MIGTDTISEIVKKYDVKDIHLAVLGSHSALEIMDGAKDEGLKTVCVCQKGRELPYLRFKRLADEIILVDKFSDLVFKENQDKLRENNAIIVLIGHLLHILGTIPLKMNYCCQYLEIGTYFELKKGIMKKISTFYWNKHK
jgi:5-formaminoimidazole-4-carboxamide-1-(beta)-D-ribofuranosyl 5'-monophosphate synthetase